MKIPKRRQANLSARLPVAPSEKYRCWGQIRLSPVLAAVLVLCLGVNVLATAATLKGTAKNGTTGKPAAGDEVVLLSLDGGMTEIGRGQTDASGRFRFTVADLQAQRLVRVVHQGVAYLRLAPPGVNLVEVQIYDVARKLDEVTATRYVQRFQTEGDTLQVIEEITVRNASDPPRTLMNERPFEIHLPPEAQIVAGGVQIGGGQRLRSNPIPGGEKGWYYFPFPLRPGHTRFAVAYRLPYGGEAVIEPNIRYPLEQLSVVLPKSMKFEARTPGMFQPMPSKTGTNMQITAAVKPGQPLAFRVSRRGTLSAPQGGQSQAQRSETARPGSVPEVPSEPARPPDRLRWLILGGLAVILTAGAVGAARAGTRKLRGKRL
ncbi:MAG: hypothetical protein A3H27_09455 [Acidobacteria bacterium RIFCSPLOWO2_02_FULL_59_13]|nr:MAG: hypothetical protein A3H27_09455 [Acidobacteria bacterium RIFCSPLOWO2_02_FULL_59_13]